MSFRLAQGVQSLEQGLRGAAANTQLPIRESGTALPGLAGTVIGSLLAVTGLVFFMLTVYGGFIWMAARGNTEQVDKAKRLITAAVIGMVIVMLSYVVTNLVLRSTQGSGNAQTTQTGSACAPVGTDAACGGKNVGDACTDPGGLTKSCQFVGDPINACRCGG